jgi:hypothetical protein
MLLSSELMGQVAAALSPRGGDGATAPVSSDAVAGGEQRRREPRVGVRSRVTIIPLTDSVAMGPFEVPVRDLSAGGIGFLHRDKIALDEQFVVLLPDGRDVLAMLCQVAYYQPLSDHSYAVGAKFVRVLRQPAAADGALSLPAQDSSGLRRAAS